MENTVIPLTVVFIDDAGTIVGAQDMEPQTDLAHCAPQPVRRVIERDGGGLSDTA
jgi:uncharacterized membrane protein (UPF0127 family)